MPEIEFDGTQMFIRDDGSGRPDWSVAISEYELHEVASTLPSGKSLPVAVRGDADSVLVLVPTASDMGALVALARMRDARMEPRSTDAQNGAQEATQQPRPSALASQVMGLLDALRDLFEDFMRRLRVSDQVDHQNVAGDLADDVLSILCARGVLPRLGTSEYAKQAQAASVAHYETGAPVSLRQEGLRR